MKWVRLLPPAQNEHTTRELLYAYHLCAPTSPPECTLLPHWYTASDSPTILIGKGGGKDGKIGWLVGLVGVKIPTAISAPPISLLARPYETARTGRPGLLFLKTQSGLQLGTAAQ